MTDAPALPTAPEDHLEVTYIDDSQVEPKLTKMTILMSSGLLMRLMEKIPNPMVTSIIDVDPEYMGAILDEVLMPRSKRGKPEAADWKRPELQVTETKRVLRWVKAHVLGFFIESAMDSRELFARNKEILAHLESSMTGSPA